MSRLRKLWILVATWIITKEQTVAFSLWPISKFKVWSSEGKSLSSPPLGALKQVLSSLIKTYNDHSQFILQV